MAVTADIGGEQSGSLISQVPKPILIGVVAAALFMAYRTVKGGGAASSSGVATNGQTLGLPNTAVMLGSMQEQLLNVLGAVSSDQANTTQVGNTLSDQISGATSQVTGDIGNLSHTMQVNDTAIQSAIQSGLAPPGLTNTLQSIISTQNQILTNTTPQAPTSYTVHGVKDYVTTALSPQQALDIAIARAGYAWYGGPPPGGGAWFDGGVTNNSTGETIHIAQ